MGSTCSSNYAGGLEPTSYNRHDNKSPKSNQDEAMPWIGSPSSPFVASDANDSSTAGGGADLSPIVTPTPQRSRLVGEEVFQPPQSTDAPSVSAHPSNSKVSDANESPAASVDEASSNPSDEFNVVGITDSPMALAFTSINSTVANEKSPSVASASTLCLTQSKLIEVLTLQSKILVETTSPSNELVVNDPDTSYSISTQDTPTHPIRPVNDVQCKKARTRARFALLILFCFYSACLICVGWLGLMAFHSAKVVFLPQTTLSRGAPGRSIGRIASIILCFTLKKRCYSPPKDFIPPRLVVDGKLPLQYEPVVGHKHNEKNKEEQEDSHSTRALLNKAKSLRSKTSPALGQVQIPLLRLCNRDGLLFNCITSVTQFEVGEGNGERTHA